jgi:molybdenum cofactor synthesis domain-containing protein
MSDPITAAILVIGDEILSGRTKDKNIGTIADYLSAIGIDLKEVRIVPDEEDEIVAAINALRRRYTYLFTTGGIGPTHDDITADCVAKALDVPISMDDRALAKLRERYVEADLTEGRLRMARIPHGADLIENPISKAPGFRLQNVIVMAGVPSIMQAMLDHVAPTLRTGIKMNVETLDSGGLPEGVYAGGLGEIAARFPDLSIGSYPSFTQNGFRAQIVLRGKDADRVRQAVGEVEQMITSLKADRLSL